MTFLSRCVFVASAIFSTAGLVACGDDQRSAEQEVDSVSRIEGTVTYRERMLLPPGVQLEVQLQDISRADAGAAVLATVMSSPEGAPPYPFSITYEPESINAGARYALRAMITRGDSLLFTTTEYIDPFAEGPLDVVLQRVAEPVAAATGPVLEGPLWTLQTLREEPAIENSAGKRPEIQFGGEEQQVSGFSGCNRFTGTYSLGGASLYGRPLSIGPLASTKMACADGGQQEQSFLDILGETDNFTFRDGLLALKAGSQTLATFKAN